MRAKPAHPGRGIYQMPGQVVSDLFTTFPVDTPDEKRFAQASKGLIPPFSAKLVHPSVNLPIVQSVYPSFTSASDETIRATALDILRYLPLRTANEITYALDLVNNATDQQVQAALATALQYATPKIPTAKDALKLGRQSPVEVVREAVEKRLARLKELEEKRTNRPGAQGYP